MSIPIEPEKIDALACACERLVASELDEAHDSIGGIELDMMAIDRAISFMDRAVRLREILGIALSRAQVQP